MSGRKTWKIIKIKKIFQKETEKHRSLKKKADREVSRIYKNRNNHDDISEADREKRELYQAVREEALKCRIPSRDHNRGVPWYNRKVDISYLSK